jgi:hypothetical protein
MQIIQCKLHSSVVCIFFTLICINLHKVGWAIFWAVFFRKTHLVAVGVEQNKWNPFYM